MITSRPLTALLALSIAVGAASSARAQGVCNLPETTVAARNPADVDAAAIKACVDASAPALAGGDYDAIRQARQNLLTPFRSANISVFFRLAYSDSLAPVLTPLVKNASDDVAINALRIAGELGTKDGADLCITALADARAGVRMMAASGLSRTFVVLWSTPTIAAPPFVGIEQKIAAAMAREADPEVLDGFAMAYESALQIPSNIVPDAQNIALRSGATEFGKIARKSDLKPDALPALLRASKSMLDTLRNVSNSKPQQEALREAGGFGGDLLAHTLRRLRTGDVPDAERAQLAVLVGQAQNLVSVSGTLLGMAPKVYKLDMLVSEKKDQQFFRDVLNVIGSEGDLVKPPFGHSKSRFIPAP